jgi:hypothetical protein
MLILIGSELGTRQREEALLVALPASLPTAHAAALKIEFSAP